MDVLNSNKNGKRRHYDSNDILLRYASLLNYGEFHVKMDKATGLKAIIAIHNTQHGPALGGCRMISYQTTATALEDALRLGYMMSLKAALANLPHGGAKAVLIKPAVIHDRAAYFARFGEFINQLNGRYITAVDSGTSPADMDLIARHTSYVTCTSADGDVAPFTAYGVLRGIEAAVQFKLGKNSLEGLRVAIQGVGHVGYELAKLLSAQGAKLIVSDIDQKLLTQCQQTFAAEICPPEKIYEVEADIFAPCALGAILNKQTIKRLKVAIIAGSANNQLAHMQYGKALHARGILYAPDFVVNAGGLIQASALYIHRDKNRAQEQISHIYDTLLEIFARSAIESIPPAEVSEKIALERLSA